MPRYVKAYESLFDHELFRDRFSRRDAWLWLITRARWRDQSGGGLRRGQVLGARSFLAAEWGWGEQEVRTFLAQLVARNMVEINQQGSRRPAVITICNYEKFQGTDENDNPNANQHPTSTQPAPNQHLTTLEERKKDRREEGESRAVEAAPCSSALPIEGLPDAQWLFDRLMDAAKGLVLPNAGSLQVVSVPYGWIQDGALLDVDILPVIRAKAANAKRPHVKTWGYFTEAVAAAKAARMAPLPTVEVAASRPMSARDASIERTRSFMSLLNHGAPTT